MVGKQPFGRGLQRTSEACGDLDEKCTPIFWHVRTLGAQRMVLFREIMEPLGGQAGLVTSGKIFECINGLVSLSDSAAKNGIRQH